MQTTDPVRNVILFEMPFWTFWSQFRYINFQRRGIFKHRDVEHNCKIDNIKYNSNKF